MSEFGNLHSCTLGGSRFQIVDFRPVDEPIIRSNRRVGSRITIDGTGYILGDDASDFADAIADAFGSFRVSGEDFDVFGPDGLSLMRIAAADCIRGGPFVSFQMLEGLQSGPMERGFKFRLWADTFPELAGDEVDAPARRNVDTSADGRRVITWEGQLAGKDLPDRFIKLLDAFRLEYPWPRWVLQHTFTMNAAGDEGAFRIAGEELTGDLPASADGETIAIDGTIAHRKTRDEQMRLVKVWDFDLLIKGVDYQKVIDRIRANIQASIGEGKPILRESVDVSTLKGIRVRASFETLEGGNGNALLNWSASHRVYEANDTYQEFQYAGAEPLLVRQPKAIGRVVVSGSATGAGVWPKPPEQLPGEFDLQGPEVIYTFGNDVERVTTYTFVRSVKDATKIKQSDLKRPAEPKFLTD